MKSSLLVRIIFFVLVAIFVLNFLVVLVYFPLSSSSVSSSEVSPLMLKLQSREAFGNFEKESLRENLRRQQQRQPIEADEKDRPKKATAATAATTYRKNCTTYGCPVYPPELTTPSTNQTIQRILSKPPTKNGKQSRPLFEFASKTFVTLTQQGASHKFNQDRGLYVSPFLPDLLPSISKSKTEARSFLACIFDGHGILGHEVAQEVVEKFPLLLGQKLTLLLGDSKINNQSRSRNNNGPIVVDLKDYDSTDIAIRKALNETFLEINEKGNPSNFLHAGCTASVTLRWGSKLYIANTGDSETVVISSLSSFKNQTPNMWQQQQDFPNTKVEYATRRDKGNQPAERARIEGLGGKIHINAKGFDPRVINYSETLKENVGLAMSRSIGDWEFEAVGVIAEPTTDVIDLSKAPLSDSERTVFLMAASDGLWEKRQKHFFATQIAASFVSENEDNAEDNLQPLNHLYDVIQKITPKRQDGYRDDITAIVVNLK